MVDEQTILRPGDLLPPFILRSPDGATVRRSDYRGRRHLVVCAVPDIGATEYRPLLAALSARHGACRESGAEVLVLTGAAPPESAPERWPFPVLLDPAWRVAGRLGAVTAGGERSLALAIADRYGEIVLCVGGDPPGAVSAEWSLPLDEILPTLELLEMRCSL